MSQDAKVMERKTRDRISEALRDAEAEDANGVKAQTLRLLKCAMVDRDVIARAKGDCAGCDEADLQKLISVMIDQREASAKQLDDAGRIMEAEREREEIEVISAFLPKALNGEALDAAVKAVVTDLDAHKLKDMGRCMSELRERYPGQIDCGSAGKAVRAALG